MSTLFDPGQGTHRVAGFTVDPGTALCGAPRHEARVYRVEPDGRATLLLHEVVCRDPCHSCGWPGRSVGCCGRYHLPCERSPERQGGGEDPAPGGSPLLALATDEAGRVAGKRHPAMFTGWRPVRRGVAYSSLPCVTRGSVLVGPAHWQARVLTGTRVVLQTRTGNSGEPDATWSPWSAEQSAPARRWPARPDATSMPGRSSRARIRPQPVLSEVAVVYLAQPEAEADGQAPKAAMVPGKQMIRWRDGPGRGYAPLRRLHSMDEGGVLDAAEPHREGGACRHRLRTAPPGTGRHQAPRRRRPRRRRWQGRDHDGACGAMSPHRRSRRMPRARCSQASGSALEETSFTWDTTEVPMAATW